MKCAEVKWTMLSVCQVLLNNAPILRSVQQTVGQRQQVTDHAMEVVSVAEEVQPQLETHPIVALVVGKLDKGHHLLQRLKEQVSFGGICTL